MPTPISQNVAGTDCAGALIATAQNDRLSACLSSAPHLRLPRILIRRPPTSLLCHHPFLARLPRPVVAASAGCCRPHRANNVSPRHCAILAKQQRGTNTKNGKVNDGMTQVARPDRAISDIQERPDRAAEKDSERTEHQRWWYRARFPATRAWRRPHPGWARAPAAASPARLLVWRAWAETHTVRRRERGASNPLKATPHAHAAWQAAPAWRTVASESGWKPLLRQRQRVPKMQGSAPTFRRIVSKIRGDLLFQNECGIL